MIVVDKKKYKMAINEAAKEVHVQVHGLMKEEDAEGYMIDLQDTINKVSRQQYSFVVDATHKTPYEIITKVQTDLIQKAAECLSRSFIGLDVSGKWVQEPMVPTMQPIDGIEPAVGCLVSFQYGYCNNK